MRGAPPSHTAREVAQAHAGEAGRIGEDARRHAGRGTNRSDPQDGTPHEGAVDGGDARARQPVRDIAARSAGEEKRDRRAQRRAEQRDAGTRDRSEDQVTGTGQHRPGAQRGHEHQPGAEQDQRRGRASTVDEVAQLGRRARTDEDEKDGAQRHDADEQQRARTYAHPDQGRDCAYPAWRLRRSDATIAIVITPTITPSEMPTPRCTSSVSMNFAPMKIKITARPTSR